MGGKVSGKVAGRTGVHGDVVPMPEVAPMTHYSTPALVFLDNEVARLARPRAWQAVQRDWVDEPELAAGSLHELLARLRSSGAETDPVARRLAARSASGDAVALVLVLAALAGVFVSTARRHGGDVDALLSDQLSLAAEVVRAGPLPDAHVLAVLVSRVRSRHRRLRRRTRLLGDVDESMAQLPAPDDPARHALARAELAELARLVRAQVDAGVITIDDWRRLVALRVHERSSAELGLVGSLTPGAVRKRVQRTADCLLGAARQVA